MAFYQTKCTLQISNKSNIRSWKILERLRYLHMHRAVACSTSTQCCKYVCRQIIVGGQFDTSILTGGSKVDFWLYRIHDMVLVKLSLRETSTSKRVPRWSHIYEMGRLDFTSPACPPDTSLSEPFPSERSHWWSCFQIFDSTSPGNLKNPSSPAATVLHYRLVHRGGKTLI